MYRTWGPLHGKPRAVVVAIPGWNATAGDIEPLARYLALRGIRVYSSGVRGQHGDLTATSQHTKGDIDDGRLWTRDFCEFTQWVRKRCPRTPLFLYGQSMGALTVLTAAGLPAVEEGGELRGIIFRPRIFSRLGCGVHPDFSGIRATKSTIWSFSSAQQPTRPSRLIQPAPFVRLSQIV